MFDVIIIGGGSAGMTAGIYAKRGGLETLIIESLSAGGQMNLTGEIENFSGQPTISGVELSMNMLAQCEKLNIKIAYDEVLSLELHGETKTVKTQNAIYEAKSVFLAMGARPREIGIENEDSYIGNGLSYCAHCDGNFFKNKDVAVVGGGNTALQDALYLSNICKKVYLIHRRDEFRGNKILSDKLFERKNIILKLNNTAVAILGEPNIKKLQILNKLTNKSEDIDVQGVFSAVGITPNSTLVKDKVMIGEGGFIITDEKMMTNENLVYAIGDIRQKSLRQIITACSDGAIAADDLIPKINKDA